MMRLVAAVLLTLLVPASSLADDWDDTRKKLIEPLNSMLHHNVPAMLEQKDIDALLRMYATDTGTGLTWDQAGPDDIGMAESTLRWKGPPGEESIRERYRALLDLFAAIDGAELRIKRVQWREPGPNGYPAVVHLLIRGTGPDGDRRRLDQFSRLHVRFYDPFWEITSEEVTARTLISSREPRFAFENENVGIQSVHANVVSPPFILFGDDEENPVRQASGVAVGDVDADGCEDLVFAGSPRLELYRNRCDGTFEDVTSAFGLPSDYPAAASGAVFFDYDNDGWADLYITAVKGGDRLFHNESGKGFVDVTISAGIPSGTWGSMPIIADYDRDGLLDVYIVRMGNHWETAPHPPYDARNGLRGTLLHNRGGGRFADVTKEAGVGSPGWDMAGAWGDYDSDGWPDLYVANEFGNNRLYRNEGDGSFSDRTQESGTWDGGSGMGATWGDYDGDGDLDLFVAGMYANSRWILFHSDFPLPVPWHAKITRLIFPKQVQRISDRITDRLSRGNSLYRNDGDGTFTDISDEGGVRDGQWGWGAQFMDYDNDGRLDLYAANGFLSGPIQDDL